MKPLGSPIRSEQTVGKTGKLMASTKIFWTLSGMRSKAYPMIVLAEIG